MSKRRESAHALVRRLNATRVSLFPPIFHNSTEGGLRQSDVFFVGGTPGSGKTTWAYRVAAKHLSCGGVVTFVFLPGSGNFQMRRFMEHLETFTVTETSPIFPPPPPPPPPPFSFSSSPTTTSCAPVTHASVIETRREALLAALDRLNVVHCSDMTDLAVYCKHEPMNSSAYADSCDAAVPLVILEGCGGKGSYLYHFERACGHEVPLYHWLFDHLQRRQKCALILIEEWGPANMDSSRHRHFARDAHFSSSSFLLEVEEESDLLRRLRGERVRPTSQNQNSAPTKRQRCWTTTMNTSITGAFLPSTQTEQYSYFSGNFRLFYLCTLAVPASTRGVVLVARLLQWRLVEQQSYDGNDEDAGASKELPRRRLWRKPTERMPQLCGEILCAAQL